MTNLKKLEAKLGNIPELEIDFDNIKPAMGGVIRMQPIMSASESPAIEFSTHISAEALYELANSLDPNARTPVTMSFTGKPRSVQVRTHRKKRINKKWAKRYGYKLVVDETTIRDVVVDRDDKYDALGYAYEQLFRVSGIPEFD